METSAAAKTITIETELAILQIQFAKINAECLDDDSSRRLANKPCAVLQQSTETSSTDTSTTSNQVLDETMVPLLLVVILFLIAVIAFLVCRDKKKAKVGVDAENV